MTMFINFLYAAITSGTPLMFGTLGEIITEKAGNLNLGVEGMMAIGAIAGFYVGYTTNSVVLAVIASFVAGIFAALIYAFLTVTVTISEPQPAKQLSSFQQNLQKSWQPTKSRS